MIESILVVAALVLVALIEGSNGARFAWRAKSTLKSAGLDYHDAPGLLIQEFGVYSLALASAYLVAAIHPVGRPAYLDTGESPRGASER